MKTGVLGGTFNPIHNAHLCIATEVLRRLQLDRILFIPAAEPPHKDVAGDVSFSHRFAMVKAALVGFPKFHASDLEVQRKGKSFSVETLSLLHQDDPLDELFFIIGFDSYGDIASWKDFTRIFALCHLVVVTRPGISVESPFAPLPVAIHNDFCYDENARMLIHKSGKSVLFLSKPQLDISSTYIRQRLAKGQSVRHLLPAAVEDYIKQHRLYRLTQTPRSP